jgi:hypothetical protein
MQPTGHDQILPIDQRGDLVVLGDADTRRCPPRAAGARSAARYHCACFSRRTCLGPGYSPRTLCAWPRHILLLGAVGTRRRRLGQDRVHMVGGPACSSGFWRCHAAHIPKIHTACAAPERHVFAPASHLRGMARAAGPPGSARMWQSLRCLIRAGRRYRTGGRLPDGHASRFACPGVTRSGRSSRKGGVGWFACVSSSGLVCRFLGSRWRPPFLAL